MVGAKQSDYVNLTDDQLVLLSQKGDEVAFNTLAARYLKIKIKRTNSSYLDSEDFIQEGMFGFLNAVRTFDFSKGFSFKSYASVCMRNSMNSAAGGLSNDLPVDNDIESLLDVQTDEDPLNRIIDGEKLSEVLNQCEVCLSELEKTVIFLRASGMSYAEIGDKLNMEPKSVDNAVQRARKKLKQLTE